MVNVKQFEKNLEESEELHMHRVVKNVKRPHITGMEPHKPDFKFGLHKHLK